MATKTPTRLVLAFFLILPLFATYPIVRNPARYTYFNHPDTMLNLWILAWDAHALHAQPTHIYDANIFFPERHTLAYSETLFGYLPVAAPVLLLGGSPILAFNIVLWLSFTATGFSMYLLARRLTGGDWPALVAGCVYTLVSYRFVHVAQIQLEAMFGFPLAFLFLDRFWETRSARDIAAVGVVLVGQTLCCIYYGLFLATILGAGLVLPLFAPFNFDRRRFAVATVGLLAAGVVLMPILAPYESVHHGLGLERPLREIADKAAVSSDYLASASRIDRGLGAKSVEPNDFLFPGIVAGLLAAVGIVSGFRRGSREGLTRGRLIAYGLVGIFGVLASFGPHARIPVFRWLYETVPFFHGIRAVSRFGVLTLFAVSTFAAFGAAFVDNRIPERRRWYWRVLVAVIIVLEMGVAPLEKDVASGADLVRAPDRPPLVYRWLAEQPGDFVILELPIVGGHDFWQNAPYVYWSTVHWKHLVNGYSGYAPPEYAGVADRLRGFPDESSRLYLMKSRVRFVLRHWSTESETDRAALRDAALSNRWLKLVALFPDCDVYQVAVEP